MWKLILFIGIFTLTTNGVLSIHDYYLDNHCGDTISTAFSTQVRLRLTTSFFSSGRSCTVTFRLTSHRYMLYFKDINIKGFMGMCSSQTGWLEIHDGSSKSSSSLTSNAKLCGYSPPSSVYRSTYSDLTFYFTSGRSSYSSNAFDIILTPYHTGYCYSYEYDCNNGRCISNSLTCSGYNSCGDNSDCQTTISVGGVAGGVVGGIVFVICVVIAVLVCRRRRAIIVRQPVGVSTVSTTVTPPPYTTTYSQPPPQPYPQPYPQPAQSTVQYPQPVSY